MTDLHWLSATALRAGYDSGAFSPTEVTGALLTRIERLNPALNAFIRIDAEAALAAAASATQEIAAGRPRGPLHGVPVGIKDIIDVAGLPTTCHSKILVDNVAKADAQVVGKLRAGGAIVLGKLSTHEFAVGGPCFDLPFPPARNPWNTAYHPGGSSSGSGSGLAAGLFPLALGTDTGGSVRHPGSACGISGMKPTYGLVSRRGVFPLSFTLDHVGPMARSAADAALLLEAIAGYDPADPGSAPAPSQRFTAGIGRGARGLRVGFVRHFHEDDMVADHEVAAGIESVAKLLAEHGARVSTVTLPSLTEFNAVNRIILGAEGFSIHAPWLRSRPADYAQATRQRLMTGAFMGAGDYVDAQRQRLKLIAAVNAVLADVDVLLTASSMDTACLVDDWPTVTRTYGRQARMPFNVTGHPAISIMTGLSSAGLPMSAQIVGRAHADATVLQVADAIEREAGWLSRHPSIEG
jgi:aspartyl-tRNA(Asn)/glutamyl-tRNA(Gln) amidotransferase subunit A